MLCDVDKRLQDSYHPVLFCALLFEGLEVGYESVMRNINKHLKRSCRLPEQISRVVIRAGVRLARTYVIYKTR